MQKLTFSMHPGSSQFTNAGKPSIPFAGRLPVIERKISDPSSVLPNGESYPIPSFFEYRIKPRDFDIL